MRRLISPLELYDASAPEWQMPDFIRADTEIKPGLLEGLVPNEAYNRMASPGIPTGDVYTEMASPICASWNQIADWLRRLDPLRRAA